MSAINWDARGIEWVLEEVSEQVGTNKTSRRVLGSVPIPIPRDLDKIVAEYGADSVMGSLNGTSWRVIAQDIGRRGLAANISVDEMKSRFDARIRGLRNAPMTRTVVREVVVEKVVRQNVLPDGAIYTGSDEVEYQQMYAAALEIQGVPAAVAVSIARNQTLA